MQRLKDKFVNILRWSERYTKTDMLYLTSGGLWLTAGNGINILSGLILSVAFANLLPQEAFGTYQFVFSLAAIVGAFSLTGIKASVMRSVSMGLENALQFGFITHLKWSVGIALGGFALAAYYFINDSATLAISLLVVGSFSPFLESFKIYQPFFTGKKDFRSSVLFGAWRKPIPIIALLVALAVTDNPAILVFVYFLSHTATAGALFWYVLKKYPGARTHHDTQNVAKKESTLVYAKHLSFLNILGSVAENLDKVLLFHYLGAAEVAVYTLARMPQSHISKLAGMGKTLSFPKMTTQPIAEIRRTLPRKLSLFFLLLLGIVIIYALAAPFIFRLLFPQYIDAVLFSQALAFLLLFMPFSLMQQVFGAHARKKEMYILSTGGQIIKIALLLALLPLYGIWGAVAALFATQTIKGIASAYFLFTAK